MNKFNEREQTFEKKFANDQELQFKVNARKNKYIAEWASKILNKNEEQTKNYVDEIIKLDFKESGHIDVVKKIKIDFENFGVKINQSEIDNQMELALIRAKKDFI